MPHHPPAPDRRRRTAAAVLAGAVLVLASACGGDPNAPSEEMRTAAGPPATVPVAMTEFALGLPTTTFAAGTYTFDGSDDGKAPHALAITGPGVEGQHTETVQPGGHARMTVTLRPGTYELWCPVGKHRQAGMTATLTVTGAPTVAGSGY